MSAARERRLHITIVVVVLIVVVGGSFAIARDPYFFVSDGPDLPSCDEWRFDRDDWEDPDRVSEVAYLLVRCDTLAGTTRHEVVDRIGKPQSKEGNRWIYSAGTANDSVGPGDANYLTVRIDEDNMVERATLAYAGKGAAS